MQGAGFFPFREALAKAVGAAPHGIRETFRASWPDLAELLSYQDVKPVSNSGTGDGEDQRARLFFQVTNFLMTLSRARPVAVLLDDLQWADKDSIDLLHYLARALARSSDKHPVLLVGAIRTEQAKRSRALTTLALNLESRRMAEKIELRPLAADDIRALIAAWLGVERVSDEFAHLLHRRSDGNPFIAHEYVLALIAQGDVYRDKDGNLGRGAIKDLKIPDSLQMAVEKRLAALSDTAQEVLREASALGRNLLLEELLLQSERPEPDLESALDAACRAELIQRVDSGPEAGTRFRFAHALTQEALYASLPLLGARRLHRDIGEALERLPESTRWRRVTKIAHHFLLAEKWDRAASWCMAAGKQQCAVHAYAQAEHYFQAAYRASQKLRDPNLEAEALEAQAEIKATRGRYKSSIQTFKQAIVLREEMQNGDALAHAMAQLGYVQGKRGAPVEGIVNLESQIARLDTKHASDELAFSTHARAELYTALAFLKGTSGLHGESLEAAENGLGFARQTNDALLEAQAQALCGFGLCGLGRLEEADRALSVAIPELAARKEQRVRWLALNVLSFAHILRGSWDQGEQYVVSGLAAANESGEPANVCFMTMKLGHVAFCRGRWDEAQALMGQADALAQEIGLSWGTIYGRLGFAFLNLVTHPGDLTARGMQWIIEKAKRGTDLQALRYAERWHAEYDLVRGNAQAAYDRLEPLVQNDSNREVVMEMIEILPILAGSCLVLGQLEAAEGFLTQALATINANNMRPALCDALGVKAQLLAAHGRLSEALEELNDAYAIARGLPYPYGTVRLFYTHGNILLASGDRAGALAHFTEGLSICKQLGEHLYGDGLERAINDLEEKPVAK
jgi:tetratricopeptide (TPR) repeat protein